MIRKKLAEGIYGKFGKNGQEEMVGFALIIIIVGVILLIFLGFAFKTSNKDTVESYEVESFLHSVLQYTSECENYYGHRIVRDLIFDCHNNNQCLNGENSCTVLNKTLEGLIDSSWIVGEDYPEKGYILKILFEGEEPLVTIQDGNLTGNLKGAAQEIPKAESYLISFDIYY